MTVAEVADHLRLSRAKVYEMAQDGQIPCTKLAGRWRFSRGEIDTWMLQGRRIQTQNPTFNRSEGLSRIGGGPMQVMTTRELQWLVGQQQPPCVSIYLPTHRHHPGAKQDPIRFKNLLAQATDLLRERYRDQDVGRFLAPVEALSTSEFWQYQDDGLVVFCSLDTCVHYRLPVGVPELVVVSNTFHTKPLVGYLNSNRHYFVLSLSQKDIQLYEGTPHTLSSIDAQSLGQELNKLLGDPKENALLAGGGEGDDRQRDDNEHKKELVKYFRAVDRAVWPLLRDEHAPLVLAAVGYLQPLFREACRYPHILDQGIEGSVEGTDGT